MYKEEMNVSGADLYSGLQKIFPDEKDLTLTERLEAARGPLLSWYQGNKRDLPWRENQDAYRIWISEIMLQQTRVEAVIGDYDRFLEELPDVQSLAAVSEERLLKLWEGLGYYNRARNLQKAAGQICEQYQGKFPESYEEWLALPGIGAYTAGAVTSIAFGKKEAAVDGNVYRIYTRLYADDTEISKTAFQRNVRETVKEALPEEAGRFNQALMDLGALICIPNGEPHCSVCPVAEFCKARKHGTMQCYPVKKTKKERKLEQRTIFVIECQGKYMIRKRPEKGLLAGMWELPGQEQHMSLEEIRDWTAEWDLSGDIQLLGRAKHIFSHVEWHMLGYGIHLRDIPEQLRSQGIFCDAQTLREQYSIPTAFAYYLQSL